MTYDRFLTVLGCVHSAVSDATLSSDFDKDWKQIEILARQFGKAYKITTREIEYVLENPLIHIIHNLAIQGEEK